MRFIIGVCNCHDPAACFQLSVRPGHECGAVMSFSRCNDDWRLNVDIFEHALGQRGVFTQWASRKEQRSSDKFPHAFKGGGSRNRVISRTAATRGLNDSPMPNRSRSGANSPRRSTGMTCGTPIRAAWPHANRFCSSVPVETKASICSRCSSSNTSGRAGSLQSTVTCSSCSAMYSARSRQGSKSRTSNAAGPSIRQSQIAAGPLPWIAILRRPNDPVPSRSHAFCMASCSAASKTRSPASTRVSPVGNRVRSSRVKAASRVPGGMLISISFFPHAEAPWATSNCCISMPPPKCSIALASGCRIRAAMLRAKARSGEKSRPPPKIPA